MFQKILIVLSILFFSFSPNSVETKNVEDKTTTVIAQEITALNNIIFTKLENIIQLEEQAANLLKEDSGSKKAVVLLEKAKLQRMMILKYKAAIACRTRS